MFVCCAMCDIPVETLNLVTRLLHRHRTAPAPAHDFRPHQRTGTAHTRTELMRRWYREGTHEFLRSLGAEPLTYGQGLTQRIAEAAREGLDAVVDFVGGEDWVASLEHLKTPERVASVADAEVRDKGGRYIFVRPNPVDLLALTELVEAGSVKPVLAEIFPLERAADAFRSSIEGHVRGKIAITIGDRSQ